MRRSLRAAISLIDGDGGVCERNTIKSCSRKFYEVTCRKKLYATRDGYSKKTSMNGLFATTPKEPIRGKCAMGRLYRNNLRREWNFGRKKT
jgi:hypothetical protein